jgi:murein L,D-transpeptidase YcbB/YkuD
MYRGEERWVRLKQPVPVHLMYSTVWVDEAGRAQFRRDIYGHDARQGAALEAKARKVNPSTKS